MTACCHARRPAAVSSFERPQGDEPPSGNRKVMIYVAPEVHRAVRQVALDEDRSTSDIYVEAARAFLAHRGVALQVHPVPAAKVEPEPSRPVIAPSVTTDDIAGLMDALAHRIEVVLESAVERVGSASKDDLSPPAGIRTADAMTAVLRMLREAGSDGIGSAELDRALHAARIRSGTAEQAKAVLRDAGLARYEKRRWYSAGG